MNWERYAPLTGVGAVVLWIVGTFLLEKDDRPEGKDTAAFVAWVEKNDTAIIAGAFVFGLGVVLFVWMLGSLRSVLFAAEGGTGRLATIAFGSGIATAISMMFTYFPQAQAAFDVDDTSETSTDALVHVGDAFFGGVELFAIPLTAATALVILRYGALPRWFAWLSLALALILVVFPIGWLGVIVGLPLWTLIASVLLLPAACGRAGACRPARGSALAVDSVAFDDLVAPGAGLDAAVLDQLLEALEVGLDRTLVSPDLLGRRLDEAFRLPGHDHLDPRPVVTKAVEPDLARVLLALDRAPRDVAVGLLVGDLRLPLLASAAKLGDPAEVSGVELRDRLDVLHELRELLELRPLVVRGLDRNLDLDRLLDLAHASLLSSALLNCRPTRFKLS